MEVHVSKCCGRLSAGWTILKWSHCTSFFWQKILLMFRPDAPVIIRAKDDWSIWLKRRQDFLPEKAGTMRSLEYMYPVMATAGCPNNSSFVFGWSSKSFLCCKVVILIVYHLTDKSRTVFLKAWLLQVHVQIFRLGTSLRNCVVCMQWVNWWAYQVQSTVHQHWIIVGPRWVDQWKNVHTVGGDIFAVNKFSQFSQLWSYREIKHCKI